MRKLKFILEVPCFPGHYESYLTSSDTDYYAMQEERDYYNNEEGFACTEDDFEFDYKRREQDVNEAFIAAIADRLADLGMIESMEFESMTSPKYYNFETDRLWAHTKMTNDWVSKMRAFIKENEEWLRDRIREDWSSCDGFWSFTDNDLDDWYAHLFEENDEKYINLMLTYMLHRSDKNLRDNLQMDTLEDLYDGYYVNFTEDASKRYDEWKEKQEADRLQLEIPFEE